MTDARPLISTFFSYPTRSTYLTRDAEKYNSESREVGREREKRERRGKKVDGERVNISV